MSLPDADGSSTSSRTQRGYSSFRRRLGRISALHTLCSLATLNLLSAASVAAEPTALRNAPAEPRPNAAAKRAPHPQRTSELSRSKSRGAPTPLRSLSMENAPKKADSTEAHLAQAPPGHASAEHPASRVRPPSKAKGALSRSHAGSSQERAAGGISSEPRSLSPADVKRAYEEAFATLERATQAIRSMQ